MRCGFFRPAVAAGVLGLLVASVWLWAFGPDASATKAQPKFHLAYEWKERQGPLTLEHTIHVYGNGTIRYTRSTGFGPPVDYTPPRDRKLAEQLERELIQAAKSPLPLSSCGAPRGGVLMVEGADIKKKKLDLNDSEGWQRYGRLARKIVSKVMGPPPTPLAADCQVLRTKLKPGRGSASGTKTPKVISAKQEPKLLAKLGEAEAEEERREALAALAWCRGGDPFFRYALLKSHPTSPEAQALLEYHTSALVRGIVDSQSARWLLKRLGRRKGPEYDYHRAILYGVLARPEKVRSSLTAFWKALGQPEDQSYGWVDRAVGALATVRKDEVGWGQVRLAHARLFVFYDRLAEMVWGGKAEDAPPLAIHLVRRAIHHARLAFFSRGPRVRGSLAAEARKLAINYYAVLAKGRWYRHPVWHRLDLMGITGYLRRNKSLYRNTGFAGPDPPEKTVARLVRLRRYRSANRFVNRVAGGKDEEEAKLRIRQGIALLEMEEWHRAHAALLEGAKKGSTEAWAELVSGLVEQGKLGAAAAQIAQSDVVAQSGPMLVARAELERRKGRWKASLGFAKKALKKGAGARARHAAGLAYAALGKPGRAVTELEAALSDPRVGCRAQQDLAALYLRGGMLERASAAARSGLAAERCSPGWAHSVLAAVAALRKQPALAKLLSERAEFHAQDDPDALFAASRVLVHHHVEPGLALRMLRKALARRPGWSRPRALVARLLAEGGLYHRARLELHAALKVKPLDPAYRALLKAIIEAEARAEAMGEP
jgi:tetratricopeptide (TPR) repeat protein